MVGDNVNFWVNLKIQ